MQLNTPSHVMVWHDDVMCDHIANNIKHIQLSSDELTKAHHYKYYHHRTFYTRSHQYLRWVLSEYINIAPDDIQFNTGPYGKPSLAPHQNPDNLHFNMSHCDSHVLIAIGTQNELGVDIESTTQHANLDDIAQHCLSPIELSNYIKLNPHQKKQHFYIHWTAKEAYLKALGVGLNKPMSTLSLMHENANQFKTSNECESEISIDILDNCVRVFEPHNKAALKAWKVIPIQPFKHSTYACALAVANQINTIVFCQLKQKAHFMFNSRTAA